MVFRLGKNLDRRRHSIFNLIQKYFMIGYIIFEHSEHGKNW